jgi:hypothetical protein
MRSTSNSGRPRLRRDVLVLLVLLLLPSVAPAQTTDEEINALFGDYFDDVRQASGAARGDAANPAGGNVLPFFVWYSLPQVRGEILRALENQRAGKQVGAPVLPAGSTSLVAKGDTPRVIGLALEHGFVTGSRSGNSVTIRGNAMGVIDAARRRAPFLPDTRADAALLRRFSFSASFQPGNASDTADPAVVDQADRLTAWTARFDLVNQRDPRAQMHGAQWTALFDTSGATLAGDSAAAFKLLAAEPSYDAWLKETRTAAQGATDATLNEVLLARIVAFQELAVSESTALAMLSAATSYQSYLQGRETLIARIAKAPVVSVEYTNGRPLDSPTTSNFRVIAERGVRGGSLTGNFSLTAFDGDRPAGTGQLRDVQAAVQYDVPLPQLLSGETPTMVSFALRAQWLREDLILDDVLFPGTTGTVVVGQVKVLVPVSGSLVRVPIALTVANRSELVKEKLVRGQVGLTFDVDSLVAGARSRLGGLLMPR